MRGVFWVLLAAYASVESYRLGLGNPHRPGPGSFPFAAAVLLGLISCAGLVKAGRSSPRGGTSTERSEPVSVRNIGLLIIGMLAYAFLFDSLGFVVCTFLLFVFFLRVLALRRWLVTLLVAASFALGSHLLFDLLLNAQLPRGILRF